MNSMDYIITIRYGEIALKGQNRGEFESVLIRNIKTALANEHYEKVEKTQMRILIYLDERSDKGKITEKLKQVFGIDWFALTVSCERDIEAIKKIALQEFKEDKTKTVRVETTRADKRFALTSMDVDKQVGEVLYNEGYKIKLKNPDKTIYIEILNDSANIFFDKIKGLGGLPVGTSGKVLCLLSGGIDSPVAATLMMKRGCTVDYVHIHPFAKNEEVKESKITKLVEKLNEYSQRKARLFVAPYTEFYKKTFQFEDKNELVLFRRFIIRLANRIARENGYLGIVTGDNLSQVASQTLENLYVTNTVSEIPIYRPVLTYDKTEIISYAEKIGTYSISIQEYRDCCSLVSAKHPATHAKEGKLKEIEGSINIDEIIDKTLALVTRYEI